MFNIIILFCGLFSLIYFSLYKMLRKSIIEIRKYTENNGYKTKAEFMGYAQKYNYRTRGVRCPVLKFRDIIGKEHVIETSGDGLLRYSKGDILNINYIETEKLPDRLKLFESSDKGVENNNIKIKLYDKYFQKPYEEILLTDNYEKYKIIIKDKPTKASYYLIPLFIAIFFVIYLLYSLILILK